MAYLYTYLMVGLISTIASYISYERKEKNISEAIQDKLHELSNDGSFSFKSANLIGHLLALVLGTLLWPALVLKKILRK
jgi:hypothetical protein